MEGKAYTGRDGVKVAVIRLGAPGDNKALIHIAGTGSELDGLALIYDLESRRDGASYSTLLHGSHYVTLLVQLGPGRRRDTLYVPGQDHDIALEFSEPLTAALKPADLYQLHQKQTADGSIAKLQAFDRPAQMAKSEHALGEEAQATSHACGATVTATVDWSTINDALLGAFSISSYCGAPLSAMRQLCDSEDAKKIIQTQVKSVACRFGTGLDAKIEKDGTLTWIVSESASNLEEFAKHFLEKSLGSPGSGAATAAAGSVVPPWGKAQSLGEKRTLDQTVVCTDHKAHLVVIAPNEERSEQLFYGDGHHLFSVVPPASHGMSGTTFLDPRFFAKGANEDFRGLDMRIHSQVNYDATKSACSVRCGERTVPLEVMAPAEAKPLLLAASYEPTPQKFVPHALLRDDRGRYYFVDHGLRPQEEKSFRLFVGPKGSLVLQKMTNVVADSEGEIFSTKRGELRLVVDKVGSSVWIERGKKSTLRQLPLTENLPMVYNELGVYTSLRLGTPCDDL